MIGPRGEGAERLETFFDPNVENKQENPPRLHDPIDPEERFKVVQKKIKRQRRGYKQPKAMNRAKRRFLALALFSGELGNDTGAGIAWTLRNFVNGEE